MTIADCMSHSASSRVSSRVFDTIQGGVALLFLPGSSNLHRIAAMHGFGTRAHSNAKIAALVAPPGSCALDVREETSVSARMNVTRMGRSAQSLETNVHIITRIRK